ncbi:hypothetical protein BDZ85DRAFT_261483 [Elsinoe ampelina]|uniref:Uncharacterized protein n=1 Tax=Elsinoe ampelina TaxID=302913 RepID=A0A6A6GCB7_9PEZI|nr:hypothetical protein BDZ85DRAFT_261483 [Elsinoe ampelina]
MLKSRSWERRGDHSFCFAPDMRTTILFFAMAHPILASLWEQTFGRIRPIDVDSLPFIRRPSSTDPPTSTDDRPTFSCPQKPPLPTTDRTAFGTGGCTIYGYPSTGGVLIKPADPLDMLFLSLPRTKVSYRSNNTDEEDEFCRLLRRTGATLWASKESHFRGRGQIYGIAEVGIKVMVYGWPSDGVGVWVLRFANEREVPRDFGRVRMAMDMEEKIEIMKEYNATFVADASQVEELRDGQVPAEAPKYKWYNEIGPEG